MKFLCSNLCGEVYFIDKNIDGDRCLTCPKCKGHNFIVQSIIRRGVDP